MNYRAGEESTNYYILLRGKRFVLPQIMDYPLMYPFGKSVKTHSKLNVTDNKGSS